MQAATAHRSQEPVESHDTRTRISVLAGFALLLLLAFWMVCSHQVRSAEVRRAEWQVQQMALSDCLEYVAGSTIASCSPEAMALHAGTRMADGGGRRPANAAVTAATPVSYSYR